jgi:mRNA interferase YafQ
MKSVPNKKFKKDLDRCKSRSCDMAEFKTVIEFLLVGDSLPEKYKDHPLKGNYDGIGGLRDCHIRPDWLLIYKIDKENDELILYRTGTHADLF